ncbi:MAG: Lrp/AsnC ligand binding domain-containing protein [Asgard group archaeon]|nr:Lrp/AsnC ligand binding domain-containing protein [Asgard group archaeon]
MTVSAYIFFIIKLGKTQEVIDQLRKIPEIVSVAVVTGEYDVIAKVIVENLEELYEIATQRIHMIEGIEDTQTAVVEKEVLIE